MPCSECKNAMTKCNHCGNVFGQAHKTILAEKESLIESLEQQLTEAQEANEEANALFTERELAWDELHKSNLDFSGCDLPSAIAAVKTALSRDLEECVDSFNKTKERAEKAEQREKARDVALNEIRTMARDEAVEAPISRDRKVYRDIESIAEQALKDSNDGR